MAGRSALTWPFAVGSWPNQPVGTGATYTNAKLAARTAATAVKSQEIAMGMDQTQPTTEIFQTVENGNRCGPTTPYSPIEQVPFNQSLIVPSSTDNYPNVFLGALTDGSGNLRYEGGYFAHCTNGGTAGAGHFGQRGTIVDNAVGGGSGGSGVSTLGGTIRYLEFTNGTDGSTATVGGFTFPCIRHCLRIDLACSDMGQGLDGNGFVWPANKADGGYNQVGNNNYYSGSVPSLVNGALLAIPQTVNLNTLGLTTNPGKQLAWTLQNFGCRTCNTQHGSVWAICTEWSVSSSGSLQRVAIAPPLTDTSSEFFGLFGFPMYASATAAFGADMNILITNLYVVSNDSETNIGGGGTPLTYGAPAFGASGTPPTTQQVNGNTTAATATLTVANAKTATGSGLALLVGARAPAITITPAQVGASWTNTAQVGVGNTTVVLAAHSVTAGHFVTVAIMNRTATTTSSIASVSDGVNSYARLTGAQEFTAANDMVLEVWGAHITTTTSITITATYGGTGAGGAVASEWSGLSESLDVAAAVFTGSSSPIGPISSPPTVTAGDLVIAAWAVTGTPTVSASAFTPSGTTINVPDLGNQATGADNCQIGVSEQLSGAAGNAQSFQATTSSGRWVTVLVCLSPAASSGSSPTISISGGGTWIEQAVQNTANLGTSSAWSLSPTGQVPANGITITSTSSTGSIEYEFYEIANAVFQAYVDANGSSTAPSVQITPLNTTDVQIGFVYAPNISATLTPTSVSTWGNDAVTQGLATNANSQLVSGGNVPASTSAQTYSATASPSTPWTAFIMNFEQVTVPSQVAQPTISPGMAQVSVNWVTPNNNNSSLTSYTALVYSGVNSDGSGGTLASTITGIAVQNYSISPYVITGLTNGTRYSVAIEAINAIGTSTASARSAGVTPMAATTVPGTPVAPAVVVGDTIATVTITPPSTGGLPIQGYTFNCYLPYPTLVATQTQLTDSFTFSGLSDGQTYGFTGIAFNGNGNSGESPQTLATPLGVPATPNAPTCVPSNAAVTVTGQTPASNGSPISDYIFNCYTNLSLPPLFTTTEDTLTVTFSNLNNGTSYYFTILAVNAVGTSTESSATQATPLGPTPPTPTPGTGKSVQTGTTYQYVYKGKTTHMLYKFSPSQVPTAVLDQYGNLLEYGTYNGETIVFCSQAGEPRRSVKGSPDATDPYGFGIAVAPWESNV